MRMTPNQVWVLALTSSGSFMIAQWIFWINVPIGLLAAQQLSRTPSCQSSRPVTQTRRPARTDRLPADEFPLPAGMYG